MMNDEGRFFARKQPDHLMAVFRSVQLGVVLRKAQTWSLLLIIVVTGAFLRLHMLGVRSLWPTEGFGVLVARLAWPEFLRTMWWGEGNMALYYILLRGWLRFGDTETWLQSLSVLFGVITIPILYEFGNRFLSRKVGLAAATLLAVHSFHIEHSQELRSYSLLTLLVVLSAYAFQAVLESPDRKLLWALYVLFSALAIYAQVFAAFVLCAQWLALTPGRIKRLGPLKLLGAGVAIGILTTPLAAVMLMENKGQLDWVPRPSLAGIFEVFRGITGTEALDSKNSIGSMLLLVLYAGTWIIAVCGLLHAKRTRSDKPLTWMTVSGLAWWLGFPIVAMTGISFLKPILYPRYLLMCVPAAVLLAGQGLVTIEYRLSRGRLISGAAFLAMVALTCSGSLAYDRAFKNYGDDWRGVTRYILSHSEPGDAVIFYTFSGHWVYDYYVGRESEAGSKGPTPVVLFPLSLDRASIQKRTEPYHRVWLVLHQSIPTADTDASNQLMRETLQTRFRLMAETEYPGTSPAPGESGTILLALYAALPGNSPKGIDH
jgi:mannosyltransferase